ncbi:hypothetical protein HMPREF3213_02939 [Heyndrickxia coagulans]|uniref:Uncharacterized protein n=1 Tax=Heyndrickxia coagulans TaxID=1398 RepID=A0A133KGG9_HEYCO|nr:hypothetical protein HMPREF3213_02939 [Heyndrickxia coagulans]
MGGQAKRKNNYTLPVGPCQTFIWKVICCSSVAQVAKNILKAAVRLSFVFRTCDEGHFIAGEPVICPS